MKQNYNQVYDENEWSLQIEESIEGNLAKSFSLLAENEIYQERPTVRSALLQITDECNLACEHCAQTQCPECTRYGTNSWMEYEQAVRLIDSLNSYGLKQLILCGGEPALYASIDDLILYIQNRNVSVVVHTNGMIPLQADLSGVEVIVHIDSAEQFEVVEKNYHDKDYVVVFMYAPIERIHPKNPTWKVLSKKHNFHHTTKSKNIVQFGPEALDRQCLYSRIHIMNNFDVVAGLGSLEYIGNAKNETIEVIMNRCTQKQAFCYHKMPLCDILLM